MFDLRDYQTAAITATDRAHRAGLNRLLVVHPTGTGKTVTFSHLIAQRANEGRSIVLVHRDELAQQTVDKLTMIAPELTTGIVKAEQNEIGAQVVVASVDTLKRDARLQALLAGRERFGAFGTVVVDEAHHAPAPGWSRVLTELGAYNPYGPLITGFTATPERDGKPLGVWDQVVAYMSMREAILLGYLVPIQPRIVNTSAEFGNVGTKGRGGDYQDGDLGREMESSGAIAEIADAYVRYAHPRKAVAFLPTVATSQHLARLLVERGVRAEHLDGTTPTVERRAILARLKAGTTQVVTNCAVLTEGFDEPSLECVIIGRPTKFHGLYVQMLGRGTRLHPGKKDLLVLDVVGASERHDMVTHVDLGLGNESRKRKRGNEPTEPKTCAACGGVPCENPDHRCQLCTRVMPLETILEGATRHENCLASATKTIDPFATSRLAWLPVGSSYVLGAGKEVVVMIPSGIDRWLLGTYENGRTTVLHDSIPGDWAMGIGEDRAKAFQKLVERSASWRQRPATQAQLTRLLNEGLPTQHLTRIKTSGDASDLTTRIIGRRAVQKLASRG